MTFDLPLVTIGLGTICVALLLLTWQKAPDSFDLRHLLIDSKTQRVSLMKTGQFTALIVSTWGFIVLVGKDKLTEAYFFGYMTAWSGANLLKRWIDKDKKDEQ